MVSNRLRATTSLAGRLQRIAVKVSRTEKKGTISVTSGDRTLASAEVSSETLDRLTRAAADLTPDQLNRVYQVVSDYKIDLIVGDGGYVTVQGGNYARDKTYVLATDTQGNVVQTQVPLQYGTVDSGYSSGAPRVTFDGQSSLSGPYKYISGYTPAAGDRVVLLSDYVGSYVISGKLLP